MKAIVKCVYPERRDYPAPPINAKWNTPDEAAYMLHVQALQDWLCDAQDIHVLIILVTQVIGNAVIKGTRLVGTPRISFLLQNWTTIPEALSDSLSQLPCVILTDIKTIKVINKKMG